MFSTLKMVHFLHLDLLALQCFSGSVVEFVHKIMQTVTGLHTLPLPSLAKCDPTIFNFDHRACLTHTFRETDIFNTTCQNSMYKQKNKSSSEFRVKTRCGGKCFLVKNKVLLLKNIKGLMELANIRLFAHPPK